MSEKIDIIEFNEEKAKTWYIEKNGLSEEDKEELTFYDNIQEVFEWIYLDEQDSHNDTIHTVRYLSQIDVTKVIEAGVKTIAEYLVLDWERLEPTPYGYIVFDI